MARRLCRSEFYLPARSCAGDSPRSHLTPSTGSVRFWRPMVRLGRLKESSWRGESGRSRFIIKKKGESMKQDQALREHLVALLTEDSAHLKFDATVKDLPAELRGKRPTGAEHSPWELLEHLRITQRDILEFSRNPKHISPEFPAG